MDDKLKWGLLAATGGACYSIFLTPFLLNMENLLGGSSSSSYSSSYLTQMVQMLEMINLVMMWMGIIGGIITLIGVAIGINNPRVGWKVVLTGGIAGGGSIPTILAAILLIRPKKQKTKYNIASSESKHNYCYNCGKPVSYGESQCDECRSEVSSMFD